MSDVIQNTGSTEPEYQLPSSLYRFQFRDSFPLAGAITLLSYLESLGADGIYASPLSKSVKESSHGYDGTDPNKIDPGRGSMDNLLMLSGILKDRNMKLVWDIVPNHMATSYENTRWRDVLKNGMDSHYASYFDINWTKHKGRVLLPVLGDHRGNILKNNEIKLVLGDNGDFTLNYYDQRFPVSEKSISWIKKEFLGKTSLEIVDHFNKPSNSKELDNLLSKQNYILAYWRSGFGKGNYRRFFDINGLVGVRQEDPDVFNESHEMILSLIASGIIDGLRIDHPDGLRDPGGYLDNLQKAIREATGKPEAYPVWIEKILEGKEKIRESWPTLGDTGYPFLNQVSGLFVDKSSEEALTGFYDHISGDPRSFGKILEESKRLVINHQFAQELELITESLFDIAQQVPDTCDYTRHDLRHAVERMLIGMPVYRTYIQEDAPVSDEDKSILNQAAANAKAIINPPLPAEAIDFLVSVMDRSFMDRIQEPSAELEKSIREFGQIFQQYSGPIMAKGLEDTSFYLHFRLTSLNEVGGDPMHFGVTPEEFHAANRYRQQHSPYTMLDTTTHDTKRSEDSRMRINVLSQVADEWKFLVQTWMENNRKHKSDITLPDGSGITVPRGKFEYLIYQTLVASWPQDLLSRKSESIEEYKARIKQYLHKAVSEAKEYDSWVVWEDHQNAYEKGFNDFIDRIFDDNRFFNSMVDFQEKISHIAAVYSLSQQVLKISSPGIPVIYQGTEFWDTSLVDPDNRRAVDFQKRETLLHEWAVEPPQTCDLQNDWQTGAIKLYITQKALRARKENPELFTTGIYIPLVEATDCDPGKILGLMRENENAVSISIVPRMIAYDLNRREPLDCSPAFSQSAAISTPLPARTTLRNIFTGKQVQTGKDGEINLHEAFGDFPVVQLIAEKKKSQDSPPPPEL